jgi:hypothetical protein
LHDGPGETRALSAEQDRLYEAMYETSLTRTLSFWLCIVFALLGLLLPSFLGIMLLIAAVLIWFAVPVRLLAWRRRVGSLPAGRPEASACRGATLQAFLLWLFSPLAFFLVGLVLLLVMRLRAA